VREGLPAAQAGLIEGDYILEVNGESVDGVEHDLVVNKISAHATMVDLLAVNDMASYNVYRQQMKRPERAEQVAIELSKEGEVTHHKLSQVPGFKGLGISLNTSAIISSIDAGSPADRAGLRKDMKIVEVNGKNVQSKTYKEIAKAIKENEKNLTIGVIDMAPHREHVEQVGSVDEIRAAMNKVIDGGEAMPVVVASELAGSQSLSSKTGEKISGKN